MSNDEKRRASLDFGDDFIAPATSAPPVDANAVKAATRAAGFRETPKAGDIVGATRPLRRTRRKTGRTEQFATRLRAETLESIYAYADQHEITLAETIERAIFALNKVGD